MFPPVGTPYDWLTWDGVGPVLLDGRPLPMPKAPTWLGTSGNHQLGNDGSSGWHGFVPLETGLSVWVTSAWIDLPPASVSDRPDFWIAPTVAPGVMKEDGWYPCEAQIIGFSAGVSVDFVRLNQFRINANCAGPHCDAYSCDLQHGTSPTALPNADAMRQILKKWSSVEVV